MSHMQRHMHLAGFLIAGPVAHSHALWRHPAQAVPFLAVDYYVEIARLLERGRFDLLFFADRLAIADPYGGDKSVGLRYGDQDATRLDPMPILGALAATTRHIGWAPHGRRPTSNPILWPGNSARSITFPRAERPGMWCPR